MMCSTILPEPAGPCTNNFVLTQDSLLGGVWNEFALCYLRYRSVAPVDWNFSCLTQEFYAYIHDVQATSEILSNH